MVDNHANRETHVGTVGNRAIPYSECEDWLAEDKMRRKELVEIVEWRLQQRYLYPLLEQSPIKSGFLITAICCLLIETLQSYRYGLSKTTGLKGDAMRSAATTLGITLGHRQKSLSVIQQLFEKFFDSDSSLKDTNLGLGKSFYLSVRCGLLHQGETKQGWRIRIGIPSESAIYDRGDGIRIVNAMALASLLDAEVNSYCNRMRNKPEEDEWRRLCNKLKSVCENCKRGGETLDNR